MSTRYNPDGPYPLLLEVANSEREVGPTYAPYSTKGKDIRIKELTTLYELFRWGCMAFGLAGCMQTMMVGPIALHPLTLFSSQGSHQHS